MPSLLQKPEIDIIPKNDFNNIIKTVFLLFLPKKSNFIKSFDMFVKTKEERISSLFGYEALRDTKAFAQIWTFLRNDSLLKISVSHYYSYQ